MSFIIDIFTPQFVHKTYKNKKVFTGGGGGGGGQIESVVVVVVFRWRKESDQRAQSIVSAKTGELKNELQLKKHLHQPRAKRAEVDIHNVRAGLKNTLYLSIST